MLWWPYLIVLAAVLMPRKYRWSMILLFSLVRVAQYLMIPGLGSAIPALLSLVGYVVASHLGVRAANRQTAAQRPMRVYDGDQDFA